MQKQSGSGLVHSGRGPLSAPVIIFLRRVACLSCPAVPHQRRRHCSSPAEPSGNRGGSPSRLFRRYLGPQPRSATGLQSSPLREGSTVAERAHHAGAVPLARLLTRLSVSAPSGSFSVALTRRPVVSGADGRGHRVHAGVERGPLQGQPDQLIGGRELRDRPSQVRQEAVRDGSEPRRRAQRSACAS